MIGLEKQARLILTDSGGVQKEAYFLSIPCVTLRDQTEWIESVQAGRNRLAGASKEKIIQAVTEPFAQQNIRPETYYGNGHAAEVILQILLRPKDSV
jgi:UDP-N-acetylglucosamine 2-epimerase